MPTNKPEPSPALPAQPGGESTEHEQYASAKGCLALTLLIGAMIGLAVALILIFGQPGT